jgi:hypothetical protein
LSLSAIALGSAQDGDSVTLRLKPKKGTTYVYESVQETAAQGASGPKNVSTSSMKVLQSDGKTIKLQSTIDKIDAKQAGLEALKGMKTVMTLTPLYKFVSISSTGGGAIGKATAQNVEMAMKMTPSFPQQAIRPGYSWNMPVDFKSLLTKMCGGDCSGGSGDHHVQGDVLAVGSQGGQGVRCPQDEREECAQRFYPRAEAEDQLRLHG